MSSEQTAVAQFLTGNYFINPYPVYRRLHEQSPIFWSEIARAWIVTPFEEVEKGLDGDDIFNQSERMTKASSHLTPEQRENLPHILTNLSNWIVFKDPPDHTRLRRLISKSFTPRSIAAFEPKIESIVSELLDGALARIGFGLARLDLARRAADAAARTHGRAAADAGIADAHRALLAHRPALILRRDLLVAQLLGDAETFLGRTADADHHLIAIGIGRAFVVAIDDEHAILRRILRQRRKRCRERCGCEGQAQQDRLRHRQLHIPQRPYLYPFRNRNGSLARQPDRACKQRIGRCRLRARRQCRIAMLKLFGA